MNSQAEKQMRRCPVCGRKSMFAAFPTGECLCDIRCVRCGGILEKSKENAVPYTYYDPEVRNE